MQFWLSDLSLSQNMTGIYRRVPQLKFLDGVNVITLSDWGSLGHGYACNPF